MRGQCRVEGTHYTGSLLALAACTPVTVRVHCGNWGKIVSPLRVWRWERGLAGHPDREFADYICRGVREGFRVGFDYQKCKCKVAQGNMRSVQDHKEVVESYLREERERVAECWPISEGFNAGSAW